ncbi:MAG TPA: LLM class flavin-dependent oxidoreductase [Thermomicrobiales bacterium]|nr:LLM class flavin-dependent oxidoreductase [Thermomicrobiales bacterium]
MAAQPLNYGFVLPSGDARTAADLARDAEAAGWDGFFVWEPVWGIDAWVSLTAAAMQTERIRLGTMLTPISRMRPWKLASETATLDQLSGGRVILAVGLGAPDTGFAAFGEVTDRKQRAELMDEGLDILTGLWKGQPFRYDGKHYTIRETDFNPPPPPVQQPRIPIWVVGAWQRPASMRRALRYDGLLPTTIGDSGARQSTPDEVREIAAFVAANRETSTPFDIIVEGHTPGNDPVAAADIVRPWIDAGATWWLEAMWEADGLETVRRRVREGPPRVEPLAAL